MSKVITISGGNKSGKTSLSIKLGNMLCKKGFEVIILSPDYVVPSVSLLTAKDYDNKSLSTLLTSDLLTEDLVLKNLVPLYDKGLFLIGFNAKENFSSFETPNHDRVYFLVEKLSSLCDFLIVDTMTMFFADKISLYCIDNADKNILLFNTYIDNQNFLLSNYELLTKNIDTNDCIRILHNKENGSCYDIYDYEYVLPVADELSKQFNDSKLLKPLITKKGKEYMATLNKIMPKILEC